MATLTLQIENMHCGACVRRVHEALKALANTDVEEVRIGSARIATERSSAEVQQALIASGYPAIVTAETP